VFGPIELTPEIANTSKKMILEQGIEWRDLESLVALRAEVGGQGGGSEVKLERIRVDEVWRRIAAHEGDTFRQVRGQSFTFTLDGKVLRPSTVNQNLSQATFEKALARVPLRSTSDVQDLRGPSYLYAILMDPRIRGRDW
jgi:hypothetical protein